MTTPEIPFNRPEIPFKRIEQIATAADCDTQTVLRFLCGVRIQPSSRRRIERALAAIAALEDEGAAA